jgi:hypothetical protein
VSEREKLIERRWVLVEHNHTHTSLQLPRKKNSLNYKGEGTWQDLAPKSTTRVHIYASVYPFNFMDYYRTAAGGEEISELT